ncbi:MAG: hypothetical protein D6757_06045 [Alphaproteobacteria bacterium]|nr:MAG: hypothetical protein D6757_06045 [Alphaproteobacteria bacterium]
MRKSRRSLTLISVLVFTALLAACGRAAPPARPAGAPPDPRLDPPEGEPAGSATISRDATG